MHVRKLIDTSLWKIQKTLASKKYVDLTHEFEPGIPRWPGFPDETRKTIYWYDKRPSMMGAGFFSELFTHVGHWGTHVDPPAHFIKGLRTLDQIDPIEISCRWLSSTTDTDPGIATAKEDYSLETYILSTNHY
jgi:kynurenine formamidase